MRNRSDLHFLGIGAQKAATSWIDSCLREHPEVCMGRDANNDPQKELFFFDRHYERGIDWYRSHFSHCKNNVVIGEITPDYIFYKEVPERIHKHFPYVKFIVCLRNPIERAHSQFLYGRDMWGGETLREAMEQAPQIRERGFYAEQLARFFALFPREQFFIGLYEDLQDDPISFMQRIYAFLGIDASYVPQAASQRRNESQGVYFKWPLIEKSRQVMRRIALKFPLIKRVFKTLPARALEQKIQKYNVERKPMREKPLMDPETRRYLREIYASDIQKLEQMIGRDLSHWT